MIYCFYGESGALLGCQEVELWIFLFTEMICGRQTKFWMEHLEVVRVQSHYFPTIHGRDVLSGLFVSVGISIIRDDRGKFVCRWK